MKQICKLNYPLSLWILVGLIFGSSGQSCPGFVEFEWHISAAFFGSLVSPLTCVENDIPIVGNTALLEIVRIQRHDVITTEQLSGLNQ